MKRITKIAEINDKHSKRKLRVAAYCRVSTASNEQLISLEAQKAHYENYIQSNDDWIYAGLYYDEGITATKKEKRNGLMELMKDCEIGTIDFIITKSISRFSRNTTDCLEMVRKLQELNIPILFEKENINTGSMDSELMLPILSSMAESESVSISQNAKWSVKRRFEKGTFIIASPPYGYENIDGVMVVNEEQRKVIVRIFDEALSGKGTRAIAIGLMKDGIPTKRGGKWSGGTINDILKNEKYIGDAIFQKTYTDDNFNRHNNKGDRNKYLVENHHEAIISRETFGKVQRMIEQHAKEKNIEKDKGKYQKRYALSGKIICGDCGSTFKRRTQYKPSGSYIVWSCNKHIENRSDCPMKTIKDEDIKNAFVVMMHKLTATKKQLLKPFAEALGTTNDKDRLLKLNDLDEQLENNIEQRKILVGLMTNGVLEPGVFNQENSALLKEGNRLQAEKEQLGSSISSYMKQTDETMKLLKALPNNKVIKEFDDTLFTEFVDKITVISRVEVMFHLKCGLKLTERMVK